ncbi:hypothetical protein BD560DRAFT_405303 [Blakeslea trispora]|nr:hypothetical protein BD560DRAFT_405303 [Blakeslea trispora]
MSACNHREKKHRSRGVGDNRPESRFIVKCCDEEGNILHRTNQCPDPRDSCLLQIKLFFYLSRLLIQLYTIDNRIHYLLNNNAGLVSTSFFMLLCFLIIQYSSGIET